MDVESGAAGKNRAGSAAPDGRIGLPISAAEGYGVPHRTTINEKGDG
jgi:hypothetical protein